MRLFMKDTRVSHRVASGYALCTSCIWYTLSLALFFACRRDKGVGVWSMIYNSPLHLTCISITIYI